MPARGVRVETQPKSPPTHPAFFNQVPKGKLGAKGKPGKGPIAKKGKK